MKYYLSTTKVAVFMSFILMATQLGCLNNRPVASTRSSEWITTQDIVSLRPLLFQKEDLGWPVGTYTELTEDLLVYNEVLIEDVGGADISIEPPVDGPKGQYDMGSILGAAQDVFVYKDETLALESFELERERFSLGLGELIGFEPRLNNVVSGCGRAYDPEVGDYYNCNFMGQHGRYLTTANMTVDEEVITMEDWSNFINAIQARLIEQVAKETSP